MNHRIQNVIAGLAVLAVLLFNALPL